MDIKKELYNQCFIILETRIKNSRNAISEIQESLTSETKSSAGDKHETGRAMLQLEREKVGQQLAEIQKTNEILNKIDTTRTSLNICLGSIVYTTKSNYFISISVGELIVSSIHFFAISLNTPIGKSLLGKKVNDTIIFGNETITIKKII